MTLKHLGVHLASFVYSYSLLFLIMSLVEYIFKKIKSTLPFIDIGRMEEADIFHLFHCLFCCLTNKTLSAANGKEKTMSVNNSVLTAVIGIISCNFIICSFNSNEHECSLMVLSVKYNANKEDRRTSLWETYGRKVILFYSVNMIGDNGLRRPR